MHPKVQVDWDQEEPFPSQHKVRGEKNLILFCDLLGRIEDFCNRHGCKYQTKTDFSALSDDLQRNKTGFSAPATFKRINKIIKVPD